MPDIRFDALIAIARLDAVFAATIPPRLERALKHLDPELLNSPLRASSGTAGSSGISDPTGNSIDTDRWDPGELRAARRDLIRLVMAREQASKDLAALLNRYAPLPAGKVGPTENDPSWCRSHGRFPELGRVAVSTRQDRTRGADGNCGFCRQILNDWGTLPNYDLLRMKDRGQRLHDALIARTLGVTTRPARIDPPSST